MLITALHGLAMAIADAVPGVSGGTIGFILGFYDNFITSLHNIISKNKAERIAALKYLLKIGIGWVTGFVLSMLLLKNLFESHVYVMCSAFIGLTVAAIPFLIISERKSLKGKYYNLIWTLIGIGVVVGITMLRNAPFMDINISFVDGLHGWQYLYVFAVGFVSISAMVLPGLSGSTVMLIMGVYIAAITAAHEALHFHITGHMILGLLPMGIGLITGILVSVKGIKVALEKHRSPTIYCVIGMIAASVYAIAMAPPSITMKAAAETTEVIVQNEPMTLMLGKPNSLNIIAFLVGAAVIVALELVRLRVEKKGRITASGDFAEGEETGTATDRNSDEEMEILIRDIEDALDPERDEEPADPGHEDGPKDEN